MGWVKTYFKQIAFLVLAIFAAILGMQKLAAKQGRSAAILREENLLDKKKIIDARNDAQEKTAKAVEALAEADKHVAEAKKAQKKLQKELDKPLHLSEVEINQWLNKE